MDKEFFAQTLRKLRKDRRMSQKELAKQLGLSDVSVSRYELGTAEPNIETLKEIAKIFNVSVDELLGNNSFHQLPDKAIRIAQKDTRGMINVALNSLNDEELKEILDHIYRILALRQILGGYQTQKEDE